MYHFVHIRQTNDDSFDVVLYKCPQALPSKHESRHDDAVIIKTWHDVPHLSRAVREAYAERDKLENGF